MASASSSAPTPAAAAPKLTCLCSPTNHPGSFRCSRHRNNPRVAGPSAAAASGATTSGDDAGAGQHRGSRAASKGRSVRALLLRKMSPSDDRQHRRRGDFQPRPPSRLRLMNK